MRILTIIALAAMTFGFASCAHKAATTTTTTSTGYRK